MMATDEKEDVLLETLSPGDWFGEIALIEQVNRTANAVAATDTLLMSISKTDFDAFRRRTSDLYDTFTEIMRGRTANSLKAIPIFSPLRMKSKGPLEQFDETRLNLLGQLFKFKQYTAGQVIFSEGDPGRAFYIIISGECSVCAKDQDGRDVLLASLRNHDWFGEVALINNTRCNATVTARIPSLLLVLSREHFDQFLRIAPEVAEVFTARVSARTAERLKRIPFFKRINENKPWSKLDLLGGLFVFEEHCAGAVLFREGEPGGKFYVVVNGRLSVSVTRPNEPSAIVLNELAADDWFGEISLLKHTPRTASVSCITDVVLVSITEDKFSKFLTIAPELTGAIEKSVAARTSKILGTLKFFKLLNENKPWSKVDLLASLVRYEDAAAGEVLFSKGDTADKFYVIAQGRVEITTDTLARDHHDAKAPGSPKSPMSSLSPPPPSSPKVALAPTSGKVAVKEVQEWFGEAALLGGNGGVRAHSARALESSWFLVVTKEAFKQLQRLAPELDRELKKGVAAKTAHE